MSSQVWGLHCFMFYDHQRFSNETRNIFYVMTSGTLGSFFETVIFLKFALQILKYQKMCLMCANHKKIQICLI